jgi:AraC-like DNA-binding protein
MQTFSFNFSPIQPEMVKGANEYIEFKPHTNDSNLISLFYQFKISHSEKGAVPVIPDGCIDILFNLDALKPTGLVAASPTYRREELFNTDELYFGIRLFPDQGQQILTCSIKEIIKCKVVPFTDVSHFGMTILDELRDLKSFEERVRWVLSRSRLLPPATHYEKNILNSCLDKIYLSNGLASARELATETGYSDRYIRNIFNEYIGFSPKQFSQIIRLQTNISNILHNQLRVDDLLDQLNNYYDKSHFYKDFKRYMLLTPKEYFDIVREKALVGM